MRLLWLTDPGAFCAWVQRRRGQRLAESGTLQMASFCMGYGLTKCGPECKHVYFDLAKSEAGIDMFQTGILLRDTTRPANPIPVPMHHFVSPTLTFFLGLQTSRRLSLFGRQKKPRGWGWLEINLRAQKSLI